MSASAPALVPVPVPVPVPRPIDPRFAALLALTLAVSLSIALATLATPAALAAGSDDVASRHEQLRSRDVSSRREAANWLGAFGTADSVPLLVNALRDADIGVRALAENSLWRIWMRSGNEQVDTLLVRGSEALQAGRFREAAAVFDEVVQRDEDFAEGYNKRATALYYMGDYEGSLADIDEVLKRNRHHFGALSGAGLCMLGLEQPALALHYFQRALEINPNLPSVVNMVRQLRASGEGQML